MTENDTAEEHRVYNVYYTDEWADYGNFKKVPANSEEEAQAIFEDEVRRDEAQTVDEVELAYSLQVDRIQKHMDTDSFEYLEV